jgi:TolB-like protein/Flp pilus assembly protein TadD
MENSSQNDRLDSWKEIATYLRREVRTVRLWEEREGLPIRRHFHKTRGSIYAFKSELDGWWGIQRSKESQTDDVRLAVLPFKNLSCDPEQEFFSDGLTEEMITQLSRIRPEQLSVIACTSAMHYKGSSKSIDRIGRELNVDFILQGCVRRAGDRLRISAQLVDVRNQTNLWAESYERNVTDVFAIQCDVAVRIASSLKFGPLSGTRQTLITRTTQNPSAYEAYLKGRYYWNKRTGYGLKKAIGYFEQAILLDALYPLAHSGLADTYVLLGAYSLLAPIDAMTKAKAAAIRAVELDETLGEPHASLGEVKAFVEWDWHGAEKEYQRSIELNPNYATAYHWYANFLSLMGRRSEAFSNGYRALQLDPLSPVINVWLGIVCYHSGEYDKAAEQCERALEIDSDYLLAHWALGLIYEQKGLYQEAIDEFHKAVTASGGSTWILAGLGHAYAMASQRKNALRIIEELSDVSKRAYVSAYDIANIHAGLGKHGDALGWLEKAYKEHSVWLPFLGVDARLKSLRSDPHFQLLLDRIGLQVQTNPM